MCGQFFLIYNVVVYGYHLSHIFEKPSISVEIPSISFEKPIILKCNSHFDKKIKFFKLKKHQSLYCKIKFFHLKSFLFDQALGNHIFIANVNFMVDCGITCPVTHYRTSLWLA